MLDGFDFVGGYLGDQRVESGGCQLCGDGGLERSGEERVRVEGEAGEEREGGDEGSALRGWERDRGFVDA